MKSAYFYILLLLLVPLSYIFFESNKQNPGPQVNDEAPGLTMPGVSGDEMSLEDLKGNYVLVNFWASWCTPCRQKNPEIVDLYQSFGSSSFENGEGFAIYSVSLDNNEDNWRAAIESDDLSWDYHVSDLSRWDSDAPEKYGVSSIPESFLLSPDGKVLARGKDLDEMKEILAES